MTWEWMLYGATVGITVATFRMAWQAYRVTRGDRDS